MVFRPTPLKNDGVNVSSDDDIPNMMEKIENVPNHQPDGKVLQPTVKYEISHKTYMVVS